MKRDWATFGPEEIVKAAHEIAEQAYKDPLVQENVKSVLKADISKRDLCRIAFTYGIMYTMESIEAGELMYFRKTN